MTSVKYDNHVILYCYVDRIYIMIYTHDILHVIILPLEIYTTILALHITHSAIMTYYATIKQSAFQVLFIIPAFHYS